jgi:hypothetical protein
MLSEYDAKKLVGAYKSVLLTTNGEEILNDLRRFAQMDAPIGCDVSYAECAYRNGMQDMYKYIEALVSE